MRKILVTGSNRGIGFEFTRQFLEKGNRLFAACRNPEKAKQLAELQAAFGRQLTLHALDVSDQQSIKRFCELLRAETNTLDLLINNAGVYSARGSAMPNEKLGGLNSEDALSVLRVNALGPLLVAQECLDLLKTSDRGTIVSMTSGYGSVSRNTGYPYYYSASKAALNQLTRSLAADARRWKIVAVVMDPGWVATDMGGAGAPITPGESVRSMIEVIDRLTPAENGLFLNRLGEKQAW